MQLDCEDQKAQDKCLLQADPAHVNVETDGDQLAGVLVAGEKGPGCLDQKCDDIKPDEDGSKAASGDAVEFLLWEEKIDHATEGHVEKGIDPWMQLH